MDRNDGGRVQDILASRASALITVDGRPDCWLRQWRMDIADDTAQLAAGPHRDREQVRSMSGHDPARTAFAWPPLADSYGESGGELGTPEVRGPWRLPRRLRYIAWRQRVLPKAQSLARELHESLQCRMPARAHLRYCFIGIRDASVPSEVRAAGLSMPILGRLHHRYVE